MSVTAVEPVEEATIQDLETLKLLTNPLRVRLIDALQDGPMTVKGLAEALEESQTKLYRHVQLLEEGGILRVVDERIVSGVLEKTYWLTARHFVLDRALLARGDGQGLDEVVGHFLDTTRRDLRASTRRGVIDLERTAPDPTALLLRHGYAHLSQGQAREFYKRLLELTREFAGDPGDEGASWYTLGVVLHPCLEPLTEEENL